MKTGISVIFAVSGSLFMLAGYIYDASHFLILSAIAWSIAYVIEVDWK